MADTTYSVDIDTRSAQRALDGLKQSILGVGASIASAFAFQELFQISSQFQNLRVTLGILYKDTQQGALVFEDIKKFAAESVFSVEDLTQTVVKLKSAGLDPTIPLLKMFADTSSVAADSVGALQAITDLYARTTAGGLGLEDLNRLADRGIPVFDILSEKLGRNRLQLTALGQSAEGARVILEALQQGLTERFGGASAARLGTLSQAFSALKDNIANALDTVGQSGFTDAMSNIINSVNSFIQTNQQLFKAIGEFLGGALTLLRDNFASLARMGAVFFTVFAVSKITALTAAFVALGAVLLRNPLTIIAVAAVVVAEKMGLLEAAFAAVADNFKVTEQATQELGKGLNDNVSKPMTNLKGQVAALDDSMRKFRATMAATVNQFAANNAEMVRSLSLETSLLGTTKLYSDQQRASAEISRRLADETRKLRDEKAKLTNEELKGGRGQVIDETIAKLEEQAEADRRAMDAAVTGSNAAMMANQLRLYSIQTQVTANEELIAIQQQVAQLGMTTIEKKYADIDAAAARSARQAIATEEARIGRRLDPQEQEVYYAAATKGTEDLKRAQDGLFARSRDFSVGWKEAMNKYVEDGTNGFKIAQDSFSSLMGNMNSALDNFVMTGKLNFSDFARSVIQDLLKIQLRQSALAMFNAAGGGGGIMSSIGSLFGFAKGGYVPTNQPVLVGENGPEIISGAAGKTVTPNSALMGGGQQVTNNYYNISAVDAKSVAQLFAENRKTLLGTVRQAEKELPFRGI